MIALKALYYKHRFFLGVRNPAGSKFQSLYRLCNNKSMSKPVQYKLKPIALVRKSKLEPVLVH